jgi:hypothetical protein
MDIIKATAVLGALILIFVVGLSALSASSKAMEEKGTACETNRSRHANWLIWFDLILILLLRIWRASCVGS